MLWLKALHIIGIVCWFAGIFYLPRILVYYAASDQPEVKQQLAIMARKLYRFITPIAALALLLGLALMATNLEYYLQAGWMWAKLLAVVLLVIYHFICGHFVKAVMAGTDDHSHIFFRIYNEVPVLMLVAVVFLVVFKPF